MCYMGGASLSERNVAPCCLYWFFKMCLDGLNCVWLSSFLIKHINIKDTGSQTMSLPTKYSSFGGYGGGYVRAELSVIYGCVWWEGGMCQQGVLGMAPNFKHVDVFIVLVIGSHLCCFFNNKNGVFKIVNSENDLNDLMKVLQPTFLPFIFTVFYLPPGACCYPSTSLLYMICGMLQV